MKLKHMLYVYYISVNYVVFRIIVEELNKISPFLADYSV